MLRSDLHQQYGGAPIRILLYRELQMLELQRKSTQAVHSIDSEHSEETQLDALIPKVKSLFIGPKNCDGWHREAWFPRLPHMIFPTLSLFLPLPMLNILVTSYYIESIIITGLVHVIEHRDKNRLVLVDRV